jgi:hypothetical protein
MRTMQYSPQANGGGNPLAALLAQAIIAAIEKAEPNYMPLTQQANLLAASTAGQGLPAGPYLEGKVSQGYGPVPGDPELKFYPAENTFIYIRGYPSK